MFGKKKKIAIVSLTSCEGCQFALLDMGEKFFDFLKRAELVDMSLVEDEPFPKQKIDIAFVEGNTITEEDIERLKKIREQSKVLVAFGNCAALGGIPEIKNYGQKEKTIRYIYKKLKDVVNPDIKEIDNFVKVDFTIPGCPITGEEFLKLAEELIKGKIPEIPENQVCIECPLRATPECFLVKKQICFGPVTLAGCKAVCTKSNRVCLACRGFLKKANIKTFVEGLKKFSTKEEIDEALEIFGLRDSAEE
jgi:coenzyme F420-reducing hydrogenase gamma subunit